MLHLGPGAVSFVGAFELDAACGLVGRDFIEPFDGFARVGVDALGAILEAMELGEGFILMLAGGQGSGNSVIAYCAAGQRGGWRPGKSTCGCRRACSS